MKKTCPHCKEEKRVDEFHRHKGYSDGCQSWCKACKNEVDRKYRKKLHARKHIDIPETKKCFSCKRTKRSGLFNNKKSSWDGLGSRCKKCYKNKYSPREKRKQQYRCKYGITITDFNKYMKKVGGRCEICKKDITGKNKRGYRRAHVDHEHGVGPNFRGLLCNRCNAGLYTLENYFDEAIAHLGKNEDI